MWMYGTSDAGYQAKLGRLTNEEIEANEVATAAHRESAVKLFMDGTEARGGTSEQVACTVELVWVAVVASTLAYKLEQMTRPDRINSYRAES